MRELAEKYSPGITKAKFELRADRPLRIKNESTYDSRFNPDSDDIESVRIRSGEIRSFEDLLAFYPITYKTQSHFNAIATRPQGQLMQSVEMPPPRSTTSPSFSDGRSAAMIVPSPNSTSYPIQQFLKTSDSPIISAYSQTSSPSISSEIGRMGFTPSTKRTFGEMSTGASESS
jgi:hypothetical protein